jgi:hypothetical protein
MGTYQNQSWTEPATVTAVSARLADTSSFSWVYDVTLSAAPSRSWRSGFVLVQRIGGLNYHYFVLSISGSTARVAGRGPMPGVSNWDYRSEFAPAVGASTAITAPPVQRAYQWLRNGLPITNQTAPVYTTSADDVGAAVAVREAAYYWDDPATISYATSASVTVSAGSLASTLVKAADFTYLGAFGLNGHGGAEGLPGRGISIGSYSGAATLYWGDHQGSNYGERGFAEYVIPSSFAPYTYSANGNYTGLPLASAVRTTAPVDPTEGGVEALGIAGGQGTRIYGTQSIAGGYMVCAAANPYTADATGMFWRRPQNLATTGQVSSPWWVEDTRQTTITTRSTAGYMCKVPSTLVGGINYQTALGGDILSGNCKLSVEQAVSRRPTAIAWSSTNIATALAGAMTGSVVSATTTSMVFDTGVSGDLTGQRVLITDGPGYKRIASITAYNTTTRAATIAALRGGNDPFASFSITNIFRENPARLVFDMGSYWDFGEMNGFGVRISGVGGTTQLNGNVYYVRKDGTNHYLYTDKALTTPVNATAYSAYTSGGTVSHIPDASSTYVICRRIDGFQLCGGDDLDTTIRDFTVDGIWQEGGGPVGMCIPPGTRSLLFFGTGYDGPQTYVPVNSISQDGIVGPIGYDPVGTGTGPKGYPYSVRVYAYDLDELAAAKGTAGAFANVRPYAMFRLNVPNIPISNPYTIYSTAYEFATKRLYLTASGGPNSRGVCHVFTIDSAVVE